MVVRIPIGDFSRMTHLSVKALRHYHEVGLLEPAEVDASSGYRFYGSDQVPVAQAIRRFRDLGMPLDEIGRVLRAPDVAARQDAIAVHLRRKEAELAQVERTVTVLHALLGQPPVMAPVSYRSVAAQRVLAVNDRLAATELEQWWEAAFGELDAVATAAGVQSRGPRGALYSADFFQQGSGEVVAYSPVDGEVATTGRARVMELPAADLAVATHRGGLDDIDRTFGALGVHIAEKEIGLDGPIRELYVVSPFEVDEEERLVTEVGWPVFLTRSA